MLYFGLTKINLNKNNASLTSVNIFSNLSLSTMELQKGIISDAVMTICVFHVRNNQKLVGSNDFFNCENILFNLKTQMVTSISFNAEEFKGMFPTPGKLKIETGEWEALVHILTQLTLHQDQVQNPI